MEQVSKTSILLHRHKRKRKEGRMSGKNRFRAVVRMVIYNRPWLIESGHVSGHHGLVDDDIKMNVFKIDVQTREKYQSLTLENKALLRKDQGLRTDDDIEKLYKVIGNLKCFRRYPENVRKELVASTYFEYYGPDRVIVRQDHVSTFLGFVLRGELEVSVTKEDPVFGNLVKEVTLHLQPGAVFGEVSLLHNIPRTATVTSVTAVELLILKKDDFDRVLKASMQKQWDEISSAMKQFPYFDSWDDVATRECCMLSDALISSPQDIILGKGHGKKGSAHFVLSGRVSMVQRMMVIKEGEKYKLLPPNSSVPGMEPLIMQVCIFTQGACFNVGECLNERTFVSETDSRVLRIPVYLLRAHNVANIWERIRQFLESRLSSDAELFQKFQEARIWDKHKKETSMRLRNPNTLNDTTIHDAPYYWRVLDMDIIDGKPYNPYKK